jgi:hypothetical protein
MTPESDIIECVVHTIQMNDVEDPDLFVADPIWKWQQTEEGKWIMEHSIPTPIWRRYHDASNYGYSYSINAFLKSKDYVFWKLKYK